MDYICLDEKTNKIMDNIETLNSKVTIIKKKILTINNVNQKLEKNKILKQDENSNLAFQSVMLKNEFSYYLNIYNFTKSKYSKELKELSEYILIILVSLNKLEIGNDEKKKEIFNQIIYAKKIDKKTTGDLKDIFNNIINNLKLVDKFIKLFDEYIKQLKTQNNNKNLHSNNFEININYKKEIITIEYNKYCDKFTKTINYFLLCTNNIIDQIETSNLLKFFLNLKLKDNSIKYDCIGGVGVHYAGHSNIDVIDSSIDAAIEDTVMQGNLQQSEYSYILTKKLCDLSNMDHCFLTSSGAMACENALKMAFHNKKNTNRVLAFKHCFMGRSLALCNITDKKQYRINLPKTLNVDYLPFYDPFNHEESIQRAKWIYTR